MKKQDLIHALTLKLEIVVGEIEMEAGSLGFVPREMLERVEDILEEIKNNQ